MEEIWRTLAERFGEVKFCQMRADLCIEGYPDRNTPTVLVYRDGEIRRQILTLKELRGLETGVEDLEKVLLEIGAIKYGDSRLKKQENGEGTGERRGGIRQGGRRNEEEEDSDWD